VKRLFDKTLRIPSLRAKRISRLPRAERGGAQRGESSRLVCKEIASSQKMLLAMTTIRKVDIVALLVFHA